MATLRHEIDGTRWRLPHRCTLGRSPIALVRLADPRVSVHHAEINHEDGRWIVRDRDSRNGTRLDGHRLPVEQARPLRVGARLVLGRRVPLVVEDLEPPVPMAVDLDSGMLWSADDGLLAVPSEEAAQVWVYAAPGGYRAEVEGEVRPVTDGRLIEIGPRAWRLSLPPRGLAESLEMLMFSLIHGASGEFVALTVSAPTRTLKLPPRPHHGLLLTLARRRLADAHLALAEQGWVAETPEMAADVAALRRELHRAGIEEGGALLARRRGGQLRLEVTPDRLSIAQGLATAPPPARPPTD